MVFAELGHHCPSSAVGPALDVVPSTEYSKFATATLLDVADSEYMVPAFETICDLLNAAAGDLDGAECKKVS